MARSCLTRAGELMTIARVTPSVLDGQTPEQLDRVVDRWQRMLSGVDSRTRLYFYLLRRPIQFARTKAMTTHRAWPRLAVVSGRRSLRNGCRASAPMSHGRMIRAYPPSPLKRPGGPWWMAYAKNWMAGRRNRHESVYLHSSIEKAAASFRQLVEASRALVDDLTPVRVLDAAEASGVLNELTNRPGTLLGTGRRAAA